MKSNMRRLVIDKLLTEKEYVSIELFRKVLQMSEPTIKREIAYMRKKLNAPIVYSHLHRGYCYAKPTKAEKRKDTSAQTRRLQIRQWYSSEELYVLLSACDGLEKLERDHTTALGNTISPMRSRILGVLTLGSVDPQELQRRIRVIDSRIPFPEPQTFETVGAALSEKRRVHIRYRSPGEEVPVACDISPVRLICYRNRWYVDAYCHLTHTLKAFQIEHIEFAEVLSLVARRVSLDTVAMALDANYGIFHDEKVLTARIRVNADAAHEVLREVWHPQQRLDQLEEGSWMLSVPYIDPTEVVGEILRWGARVEVLEPPALREQVRKEAESIAALYRERTDAGQ